MKGNMRVFGCGGAGINIVSGYDKTDTDSYMADIHSCFIDASQSNLKESIDQDNVFILDDVDGSGKVRSENHEPIANVIKKILLQFEPGDMNVVVFSASGGSGSVIGPLIISELISRGENAVAVVIGSHESLITAENTMNTLKSLESIAKKNDSPVVMFYEHNNRKRSEVNSVMKMAIDSLAILSSRQNRELDSKDISNWLYFNKTTSVKSQLANLEIFNSLEKANESEELVSAASLYKDEDMDHLECIPEYSCTGYFKGEIESLDNLHYLISIDILPNIVKELKETLDRYNAQKNSRVQQASVLDSDDNVTDSGLVL